MGWFRKILGGAVGFGLGGPIGAILGAAAVAAMERPGGGTALSPFEEAQMNFFVTVFAMLGKLAKADGQVTEDEIKAVTDFMDKIHLNEKSRNFAKSVFTQSKNMDVPFEALANQFYRMAGNDRMKLTMMIDIMLRVAMADGNYHPAEERLIDNAARIFNISEEEYLKLKTQYVKDFSKYYAILGCVESDSADDIKKKYRKLASEYHPDKIAHKELPEEFMEFANSKLQEINEAYSKVKKERGFS
jgi:DnaJ like chaperone protein